MSFRTTGIVIATLAVATACSSDDSNNTAKGPGATLKCASGQDAFDTYKAAGFVAVNQAIFAKVHDEVAANGATNLGSSFMEAGTANLPATADDAATFEGKLAAFLVFAYGGPTSITYTDNKTYTGDDQDMVTAHTGLGITEDQYMYFISNIVVPALTDSGVSSDDVNNCFAPVVLGSDFEASIVNQ
jgi:hypothetical protein|nr:hypothetical protein [Kofleriaceae bacterium]